MSFTTASLWKVRGPGSDVSTPSSFAQNRDSPLAHLCISSAPWFEYFRPGGGCGESIIALSSRFRRRASLTYLYSFKFHTQLQCSILQALFPLPLITVRWAGVTSFRKSHPSLDIPETGQPQRHLKGFPAYAHHPRLSRLLLYPTLERIHLPELDANTLPHRKDASRLGHPLH